MISVLYVHPPRTSFLWLIPSFFPSFHLFPLSGVDLFKAGYNADLDVFAVSLPTPRVARSDFCVARRSVNDVWNLHQRCLAEQVI